MFNQWDKLLANENSGAGDMWTGLGTALMYMGQGGGPVRPRFDAQAASMFQNAMQAPRRASLFDQQRQLGQTQLDAAKRAEELHPFAVTKAKAGAAAAEQTAKIRATIGKAISAQPPKSVFGTNLPGGAGPDILGDTVTELAQAGIPQEQATGIAKMLSSLTDRQKQALAVSTEPEKALFEMLNKDRRTAKGPQGYNRYMDTGERVFPDVPDPQFGQLEFHKESGKFIERDPLTGKITREVSPPRGMRITTSDGTTIETGVSPGQGNLEKGTKKDLEGALRDGIGRMDEISKILNLWEPDFNTYMGSAKEWFGKVGNKLDKDAVSNFQVRMANWKKAHGQMFLKYRKWATGVAGGPAEMRYIEGTFPNINDSPGAYESSMKELRQVTNKLNARASVALREGLVPGSTEWKSFLKENPVENFPSEQERGDQLLGLGYAKPQILKILRDEGYR